MNGYHLANYSMSPNNFPKMYKPDSIIGKIYACIASFINGIHYLCCVIVEGVYQSVWASLKFAAMAGMWSGGDQNTGDKERHTRYGMSWETASCKYNNWYTRRETFPQCTSMSALSKEFKLP